MSDVILMRHAEVAPQWKSICYGAIDVPLSESGVVASLAFAKNLGGEFAASRIFHSGLARTEQLAKFIAARFDDISLACDLRLRERNYGQWQGHTWDDAYASDPENFHGLIDHPDTYRPPGGETTTEMQRRIVQWYEDIQRDSGIGPIVAISHSGPIAALAGYLTDAPANQWQTWMLGYLGAIRIQGGVPELFP